MPFIKTVQYLGRNRGVNYMEWRLGSNTVNVKVNNLGSKNLGATTFLHECVLFIFYMQPYLGT